MFDECERAISRSEFSCSFNCAQEMASKQASPSKPAANGSKTPQEKVLIDLDHALEGEYKANLVSR